MIGWIRNRLSRDEGFTLVELMVVVLVIAILIAIAIPTFLGARQRAQDRAAQSDLRNALTAAKVFYVDNEDYDATDDGTTNDLEDIEPSLSLDSTITNADATVVGYTGSGQTIVMAKQSASGTWFCIADDAAAGGGTTFGSGAAQGDVDTVADCAGASW